MVCRGRESSGELAVAFRLLLEMEHYDPLHDSDIAPQSFDYWIMTHIYALRMDGWMNTTARRLWQTSTSEQHTEIDQMIRSERDRVQTESLRSMRRHLDRFAFHPTADEVRLLFADRLIQHGHLLEAELALDSLLRASRQEIAAKAAALKVSLLVAAERWPEAVAWGTALARGPCRA